ncbi:MAG: ABC transporter permease [Chloroflexi bacterium]|nr:MAG: hypothetical protein CUN54_02200 [Phototrophicales bacterium]RMF79884.1 MAG: ABC transporter permease [Chloroflexota bacterium]
MNKTLVIAKREYLYNFRRPAFLFAAFGIPLLLIVVFAIVGFALSKSDDVTTLKAIGYVDEAGVLTAEAETLELFSAYADEDSARAALDADVLDGYFVLPPDYMQTGHIRLVSDRNLPESLDEEINTLLLTHLTAQVDVAMPLERIIQPVDMRVHVLESDRILTEDAVFGILIVPFVFPFIMFMAVQLTGGFLISSISEEKVGRVLEMLITSVTPMQLLLGKIIGLGLLGLTQLLFWLAMGGIFLLFRPESALLEGLVLPVDLVLIGLLYFVLIYSLQASLMASIGAIMSSEQEGRQIAGILSVIMMIPFFVLVTFLQNPNGTIPVILTLIPFTAPLSAILRIGISNPPLWQIVLSLILLAAATFVVVVGAARIFRWSLLMTGKRPTPREIVRLVRGEQTPIVRSIQE